MKTHKCSLVFPGRFPLRNTVFDSFAKGYTEKTKVFRLGKMVPLKMQGVPLAQKKVLRPQT